MNQIFLICFIFAFLPLIGCSCADNFLQSYDLLDAIAYQDTSQASQQNLNFCNIKLNDMTCCDSQAVEDINTIFTKLKTRIGQYIFEVSQDNLAFLNGFLNLKTMGIDNDYNIQIGQDIEANVQLFKTQMNIYINKLNQCLQSGFQQFAGTLCLSCNPEAFSYFKSGASFQSYILQLQQNNCKHLTTQCTDFFRLRANLTQTLQLQVADIIDIIAAHIGTTTTTDMAVLISSNITSRILVQEQSVDEQINQKRESQTNQQETSSNTSQIINENNNQKPGKAEQEQETNIFNNKSCLHGFCNQTKGNIQLVDQEIMNNRLRILKSKGGRSSSSSRGSSSSSSRGGSRGGTTSKSSRSTSGSRSSRPASSSKSRTGSSTLASRSSYRSSNTYVPKYSYTSSRTIQSYQASTSQTNSTSFAKQKLVTFSSSSYKTIYTQYFPLNTFTASNTVDTAYKQVLSPFFSYQSSSADLNSYHNINVKFLSNIDITQLKETCKDKSCTIQLNDKSSITIPQYMSQLNYYKVCIRFSSTVQKAHCSFCFDTLCDQETMMSGYNSNDGSYSVTVLSNRFNYVSQLTNGKITTPSQNPNYKSKQYWNIDASNTTRIQNLYTSDKVRYSLRINRFIPIDVQLPLILIPDYTAPCVDSLASATLSTECEKWICQNFFTGMVPEASKFANPQSQSRLSNSTFTNATTQSILNIEYVDSNSVFDAISLGSNSNLSIVPELGDITASLNVIDNAGHNLQKCLLFLSLLLLLIIISHY